MDRQIRCPWGWVLGLCFSPISNCLASCFASCRILCSVGNAAFSSSSGIQHGSGSDLLVVWVDLHFFLMSCSSGAEVLVARLFDY
eukprot:8440732-Prorocentrum_lima.AAC.1